MSDCKCAVASFLNYCFTHTNTDHTKHTFTDKKNVFNEQG